MQKKAFGSFLSHLQGFIPENNLRQVLEHGAYNHFGRTSTFRILGHGDRKAILQSINKDLASNDKRNLDSDHDVASTSGRPVRFQSSTWYQAATRLPDLALQKGQIQSLSAVQRGQVYFQGFASMLPALCLDTRPGN